MKHAAKICTVLFLAGLGMLMTGLYLLLVPSGRSFGVVDEASLLHIPAADLPDGSLYISYDRRMYGGDGMRLVIGAIGVDTPVGGSTLPTTLRQMPGLYEFSQMPGEEGGNVSIAGHRDVYGMEFRRLDDLGDGDEIVLIHDGSAYRYLFREASIVGPDDWSVIKPLGYSALTLTTCDPVGTTKNRLVVVAELAEVIPQIPGGP